MKKGIYKPAIDKAYTWLCSQLEKEELKPGDRLPPGRDLAKACGVSRMTIQAVIARLKKEGVVHGGPKKRLRVKGPAKKGKAEPAAAPELPKDTVARIKEEIFSDIVTGHYRPETPLPQYKELQKKYRTSHKTVHAALHGLSAEGHLVIDRRAFRVVAHGASSSENKVYLVAFSFDLTKRGFTRGAHDDLLCNQLHIECQQRNLGLAIHKVYMSQSLSAEAEESPPGFHFPADAFAFVLLLDQPYQHIPAIMRALAKTRKPVAIVDELGTWSVRETVPEKSKIRVFPFTSGETAARAIVCTLIQYGHRRFAFISQYAHAAWSIVRENAVQRELEKSEANATLVSLSFKAADSLRKSRREMLRQAPELVQKAAKNLPKSVRDYFAEDLLKLRLRSELTTKELQKVTRAQLPKLLKRPRPTAWIAVNDDVADEALKFLRANKIAVPGEVSLVSFDDSTFAMDQGISSYNFNAAAVASAIINYIVNPRIFPVKTHGERIEIGGVLVERETIGTAKGQTA